MSGLVAGWAATGSPSWPIAGAYFPAWLLCAFGGSLAAIAARGAFVASGLDVVLPFQLLVCVSIGVCAGLLAWSIGFGG